MDPESAIRDYLAALDAAAAPLDLERRAELVGEIREHIDVALSEAGARDESTVREVLERLGSPDEIVAAEMGMTAAVDDARSASDRTGEVHRRQLSVETQALLWLTIGAVVLPFIGPAIGLWTATGSSRWTLTQKRTAVLIFLLLSVMPFVLLVPAAFAGEFMWIIGSGGFALPLVPLGGIVPAAYLVASSSLALTVTRKT
jgi:uncharacterized membrane protein